MNTPAADREKWRARKRIQRESKRQLREASPSWLAKQAKRREDEAAKEAVKAERTALQQAKQEANRTRRNQKKVIKERIRRAEMSCRAMEVEATEQQRRLFYEHPRRAALEAAWAEAESGLWFAKLSQIGRRVFEGRPASCSGDNKTYTLGTSSSISYLLSVATKPEIYVVRDARWLAAREQQSLEEYLRDLDIEAGPDQELDVQDLGLTDQQPAVRTMKVTACISRFAESRGQVSPHPVNLLNLSYENMELTPLPLARHCTLLRDACNSLANMDKKAFKSKRKVNSPADIQSCQRFRICAQAGAISSWHMDNLAPYTWVTLEGNTQNEDDESVLKYWAVIDFQSLTSQDERAARQEFARDGTDWKPNPAWIRVISLIRGDTLIMPPGTIHAPITATDCLFRGGMCWNKNMFVSHTLPHWQYITRNRDKVTNEDPPTETQRIIKWLQSSIVADPEGYGISQADVPATLATMKGISRSSLPCHCKNCRKNSKCNCHSQNLACFDACQCSCSG
ncbi:hypothetical protein ACEPPN_000364 [Leptodophora sp. 'Broadleaf-Isolate-01']